ncbi:hypothetical protein SAMN05216417_10465 [Nitrosospira multiformis]|uniref:Uncharacterized protein n=1 Tax=Nitrosospira multiformis TaxID=1231 RepID=A0A1I7GB06_9PROT|nr:hypothetical protein SAMN05216417_10465 [Nitrosospira multiformis]
MRRAPFAVTTNGAFPKPQTLSFRSLMACSAFLEAGGNIRSSPARGCYLSKDAAFARAKHAVLAIQQVIDVLLLYVFVRHIISSTNA